MSYMALVGSMLIHGPTPTFISEECPKKADLSLIVPVRDDIQRQNSTHDDGYTENRKSVQ